MSEVIYFSLNHNSDTYWKAGQQYANSKLSVHLCMNALNSNYLQNLSYAGWSETKLSCSNQDF